MLYLIGLFVDTVFKCILYEFFDNFGTTSRQRATRKRSKECKTRFVSERTGKEGRGGESEREFLSPGVIDKRRIYDAAARIKQAACSRCVPERNPSRAYSA